MGHALTGAAKGSETGPHRGCKRERDRADAALYMAKTSHVESPVHGRDGYGMRLQLPVGSLVAPGTGCQCGAAAHDGVSDG